MVFRNCLGTIMSVSTLMSGKGAATPAHFLNFPVAGLTHFPHGGGRAGPRGGHRHLRTHEMGAPAAALAPLEIAVGGGGAALAGRQPVGVHGESHGTARLAPFEPGGEKNLVQP